MGRKREQGYLSLTFGLGEWAYIDGPCVVKFTEGRGAATTLAFKAPKSTTILRSKLLTHAQREAIGMTGDGYVERT